MTNITTSPAISEYLDKRLESIAKIIGDDTSVKCDVELGRTSTHHNKGDVFKAEIHIVGGGKNLFAASEQVDLYSAIDAVRDEILQGLKADKSKKQSLGRKGGAEVKNIIKRLKE